MYHFILKVSIYYFIMYFLVCYKHLLVRVGVFLAYFITNMEFVKLH